MSLSATPSLSGNFGVNVPLSSNPPQPAYVTLIQPVTSALPYPYHGDGPADSWSVPVSGNPHPDATYGYTLYCGDQSKIGHFEIFYNSWPAGRSGGLIGPTNSQVFTAFGVPWYFGDYDQQQPRLGLTPGDFVIIDKIKRLGQTFQPALRVMISFTGEASVTQSISGIPVMPVTGTTLRMRNLGYY